MVSKARAKTDWRQRFTIDACMMVKNEFMGIRKCLESIVGQVDHVHIIDTGSTDGTQDICREFPNVTVYEEAPDLFMTVAEDGMDRIHFSKTRNRTLAKSKAKWLLIVDGDEHFEFGKGLDFKAEVRKADKAKCNALGVSLTTNTDEGLAHEIQIRLLKNDGSLSYEDPVHNQLVGPLKGVHLGGVAFHTSYKKEDRGAEKESRAKPMLMKMYRQDPTSPKAPYYLQTLASVEKDYAASRKWSKICISLCEGEKHRNYSARAWGFNIQNTLIMDGLDAAEKLTYEALMHHPYCPDIVRFRVAFALTRFDLTLQGIYPESGTYLSMPQKSLSVDTAKVAEALQIGWPLVVVKNKENGE
jgi:hypothetical protein